MENEFNDKYIDKYRKIHSDTVLKFYFINMETPDDVKPFYCFATFRPNRKAKIDFTNTEPIIIYDDTQYSINKWNKMISPNTVDTKESYIEKITKLHGGFSYAKIILLVLSGLIIIAIIIVIICICVNKHKLKYSRIC